MAGAVPRAVLPGQGTACRLHTPAQFTKYPATLPYALQTKTEPGGDSGTLLTSK